VPGAQGAERTAVLGNPGRGNSGGIIRGAMIRGLARLGCGWIGGCNSRPPGANPGPGERSTAVGSDPATAVAGGAEGETILSADAPALGTSTRAILTAAMAGPRTTWNRAREASSP
jgi:hypothetical protein